ncbi:hypothetical protein [Lactobacillus panisapium]|uniref:hypothetical protein n=1 Tax=Lactobacillus panisapium TaxID=2012495 RepID=UPI0022E7E76D|nr:hypothetical protein [Lactobacillus panisapium]
MKSEEKLLLKSIEKSKWYIYISNNYVTIIANGQPYIFLLTEVKQVKKYLYKINKIKVFNNISDFFEIIKKGKEETC